MRKKTNPLSNTVVQLSRVTKNKCLLHTVQNVFEFLEHYVYKNRFCLNELYQFFSFDVIRFKVLRVAFDRTWLTKTIINVPVRAIPENIVLRQRTELASSFGTMTLGLYFPVLHSLAVYYCIIITWYVVLLFEIESFVRFLHPLLGYSISKFVIAVNKCLLLVVEAFKCDKISF